MIDFHQVGKDYYDWENFKIEIPKIRNPADGMTFKNPADSMDWDSIFKKVKSANGGKWG